MDELRRLAAMALPALLDTAVDQQLAQALIYADLAQTVSVLVRQSEVLRGVPYREFERMHAEILRSMAKLGNAVSATLDKRRKAAADAAEQSRWALMAVCAFTIAVTSLVVLLITQGIRARLRAMAGVAAAIAGGDLARRTQARGTDELAGLGLAIDQMARWPTA